MNILSNFSSEEM